MAIGIRHPPLHTVTASTTYGYSLYCIRLQPPLHTVTASTVAQRAASARSPQTFVPTPGAAVRGAHLGMQRREALREGCSEPLRVGPTTWAAAEPAAQPGLGKRKGRPTTPVGAQVRIGLKRRSGCQLHLHRRGRRSRPVGLGRQLGRWRTRALWRPRPGALLRGGVVIVGRAARGVLQRLPAGCVRRVVCRRSRARIGRKRRSGRELHLHGVRHVSLVLGIIVISQHRSRDVLVPSLRPVYALLRGTATLLRGAAPPERWASRPERWRWCVKARHWEALRRFPFGPLAGESSRLERDYIRYKHVFIRRQLKTARDRR